MISALMSNFPLIPRQSPSKWTLPIKKLISEFVKKPQGEHLKGSVMGYTIEIPFAKIINALTPKQAEKLIYEAMQK